MGFAKEICSRVFYMDEGVIYEDGSPEQVFDHPEKKKTLQFVRGLKVLELSVTSEDDDFAEMYGKIEHYCIRNQIPKKMSQYIQLAFEETVQQILLPVLDQPKIEAVIDYSQSEETAHYSLAYNGPRFDVSTQGGRLSLELLNLSVCDISYTWNEKEELGNQITMLMNGGKNEA